MDRITVALAIGAGLVFAVGVLVGLLAMISAAVHREDRLHSLTSEPPGVLARGVRRMAGVGLRNVTPSDF